MAGTVHIVGAGLAGLSAAVELTSAGRSVALYDAAPFAGGRCRTFHDPRLGRDVDNGNHLLLTGNHAARRYLKMIGAADAMHVAEAAFPFADLATNERWTVRLNRGPVPWWIAAPGRRIAGTRLRDYLRGAGLAMAGPNATVAEVISDRGAIWQRFWEPLTLAALNTTPERGLARLLWVVLRETFAKGAAFARPMLAPRGLGRALVEPAVDWLSGHGVDISLGRALGRVELSDKTATSLVFTDGSTEPLGTDDRVVLALPPTRLKSALPWIDAPKDDAGIINAHFVVPDAAALAHAAPITGVINARTHWIFIRGDVVSLTISGADRLGLMDADPKTLLSQLWAETSNALRLNGLQPSVGRMNKERRATFDQSPAEAARRPAARTDVANLFLAGDATATGLPATIEGAVRSGRTAAELVR